MKPFFYILLLLMTGMSACGQKQTFDITTYTSPKGWKKQSTASTIQFSKEDAAKGTYCLIMLFKSLPGTNNAKDNFTSSWNTVVKESVNVSTAPEMQAPATENGWEAQSGYAPFEKDGNKGIAMLITSTAAEKMVNIMVLTNTDVYEKDITAFLESVSLPKQIAKTNSTSNSNTQPTVKTTKSSGYKFTTTNFDDGWVSSVQEDFVEVTKGNIKVLIHYPNKKADAYNSVLKEQDYTAWNTLVAPRYSNLKNLEWKTIQSWQSITFMQGDATENATGKNVHIVLFKKHYSNGSGRYLEFITDSKASFEREFGAYHNTEFDWDKTANMQYRNKFAVAAQDLVGKWTANDYASLTYYYVSTGGTAGTTATTTADEFNFLNTTNYQSEHNGASGEVGNMKFSQQVYKGGFTVTNWSIILTNRFKGKTDTFNCQFEAIKGGRILILNQATEGFQSNYTLVKKQ